MCKKINFLVTKRSNITKVRPKFLLSHIGSDHPSLLIMFSADYFDQSNHDFYATEGISEVLTF